MAPPQAPQPAKIEVTVIIAAWHAEHHLRRAVASGLAQEGLCTEVVVVDDASADGTFALAQRMAQDEPRLRVVRLGVNGGPSVARNRAIDLARGRWIAVLDSDDAMRPGRLRRMVDRAEAMGADLLLGNLAETDAAGREIGVFLDPASLPDRLDAPAFLQGNLRAAGGRSLGYLKPLLRRDFLNCQAIRYDPALRNGEDFHLILACLLAGGVLGVDPVADYLYTRRGGSISDRIGLDHLAALIAAEQRLLDDLAMRPALMALIRQRLAGLCDLLTTETVLRALKAGDLARARAALVARPRATGMVARQAAEGMRRRLWP